MGNVTLSTASVPEGTCPSWIIDMWPDLVALMNANLGGTFTVVNIGDNTPDPADRVYPWIRTIGGMPDRVYVFVNGAWMSLHPDFVGKIVMWEGVVGSALWSLDGGDGTNPVVTPPTATSGAMWEQVTQLAAKFPLGAGTLPSGTVIGVGTTGGEETHILTVPEMPKHSHDLGAKYADTDCNGSCSRLIKDPTNPTGWDSSDAGGDVAHNTMPPYYGIHFIRKTIRQYYVV